MSNEGETIELRCADGVVRAFGSIAIHPVTGEQVRIAQSGISLRIGMQGISAMAYQPQGEREPAKSPDTPQPRVADDAKAIADRLREILQDEGRTK